MYVPNEYDLKIKELVVLQYVNLVYYYWASWDDSKISNLTGHLVN